MVDIKQEPDVVEVSQNLEDPKITNRPKVLKFKSKLNDLGISPVNQVYGFFDPTSAFQNAIGFKGMIQFYHMPTGRKINFKALITNFSDNFTSKWQEESVYGRMDPIPVFENTTRKISIEFDVPASGKEEAAVNLAKIDRLIQCLYPTYEKIREFNVLSTAPLFRVKFANLISKVNNGNSSAKKGGLISYIGGFNFSPDFEPGVIISGTKIYPKLIKVSLELSILHEHLPGFINNDKDVKFGSGKHNFPYGSGGTGDVVNADATGLGAVSVGALAGGATGPLGAAAAAAAVNTRRAPKKKLDSVLNPAGANT